MAYTQPMVQVYQEYENTSTTTSGTILYPCIIGPCYHIVDPEVDADLAFYGQYEASGIQNGLFPNNVAGAKVESSSISFLFKNAMADLITDCAVSNITNNAVIPVNATNVLAKVQIGDYVTFKKVTNPATFTIHSTVLRVIGFNTESGELLLNRTCPYTDPATTKITIRRMIDEFVYENDSTLVTMLLDASAMKFSLTNAKYEIDGVLCNISQADVYLKYKALRQDLSDISLIRTTDEIEGKLGRITPENPLAFGVNIAMANATVPIKCIGVTSDTLAGYVAAKNRVEHDDPVYALVPLTFDAAVLAMFKSHADEYSTALKGHWRMALGCTQLVTEKTLCAGLCIVSKDTDGDLVLLHVTDNNINFLSTGVKPGDTVTVQDSTGTVHTHVISSVIAEDILTVIQQNPFDATAFSDFNNASYSFAINHAMDHLEQANDIAKVSRSYGSRRFINVFPDICVIDDQELPGYYLCCALAAGIAGLPSHYGMTRLSVAGISAVKHSGDYFSSDELDLMADGGTLIFIQTTQNAVPFIRHQLTTDRSSVETQELSFVKNFDYISYLCRDVLDDFVGKYNVNATVLGSIYTALAGTLETLKLSSEDRIGSPVLDYQIESVAQMENVPDRVEAYVQLAMPYPLNTVGLHLQSVTMQVTSSVN